MNKVHMLPPHGNYEQLRSYQKTVIIYDLTYRFCECFLRKGDRTIDQMVQAARSGKPCPLPANVALAGYQAVSRKAHFRRHSGAIPRKCNAADGSLMTSPKGAHQKRHACVAELTNGTTIACALRLGLTLLVCTSATFAGKGQGKQNIIEGSKAASTSKGTEIKLTNAARASLEELLEDYRDFLRVRKLKLWDKNSNEARYVRKLAYQSHTSYKTYEEFIETRPAEIVANIAICLIHQANYLLDQQIRRLERDFLKEGGLRERMSRARIRVRNQQRRHD